MQQAKDFGIRRGNQCEIEGKTRRNGYIVKPRTWGEVRFFPHGLKAWAREGAMRQGGQMNHMKEGCYNVKPWVVMVLALALSNPNFGNDASSAVAAQDFVDYVLNSGWTEDLNADDAARLAAHMRQNGGMLRSSPVMALEVLGVDYPPMARIPIAAFYEEISSLNDGREKAIADSMMEIFNIQLLSPSHEVKWPPTAILHVQLSQPSQVTLVRVPMKLRGGNAYYVLNPSATMSRFVEAMRDLSPSPRPRLSFPKFEGFVFDETTVENMPPLGLAVTYHVRYGGVRIETDYQWAGRPASIPVNSGKEFLK